MVELSTHFWTQYKKAKLAEQANRAFMLVLFVAFAMTIMTHQPFTIVLAMGAAYCAFFAQIWFSSVKRRAKVEVALRSFIGASPLSTSPQLSAVRLLAGLTLSN